MRTRYERYYLAFTLTAVVVLITGIVLEASLHLAARAFPQVANMLFPDSVVGTVPDADLILKGNPEYPGLDENGFRNASVPNKVKIVSIGDSHTWGTSVELEQAWPHVLGKLTSCDVYNMSLGGYGPLQYAMLAEQALKLEPGLMLTGIYFGNDFYDNWQMYLRHTSKYPVPESLLQPAIELERRTPLARDVEDFFSMGQSADDSAHAGVAQSMRIFMSRYSSLYAFARAVKNRLLTNPTTVLDNNFQTAVAALTPRQMEYASVFEGAGWRTIFTSRYREAVVNDDDPRIRVGYWLTEWAVQRISDLAKQNGIRALFVLLPTKETVFAPKVQDASRHSYFDKLRTEENLYRERLTKFLDQKSISYIDMTSVLQSSAAQPYFESADGHPNALGHQIIAEHLVAGTGVCK